MATCPDGHQTQTTDYCEICGLPVDAPANAPAPKVPPAAPIAGQPCPNCSVVNPPDALFCEACGYDYTTGTLPRGTVAELLNLTGKPAPPADPEPTSQAEQSEVTTPPATPVPAAPPADLEPTWEAEPSEATTPPATPATTAPAADPGLVEGPPPSPAVETAADDEPPTRSRRPVGAPAQLDTVAEIWIDPDWYRLQASPDPLPSPGLPKVVPLRGAVALIGRLSRSRGINPEIDCEPDTGTSRRHAQLTRDGSRWWLEDLGSSNGTYVGDAAGPLPTSPIPHGRFELTLDKRIYVGAWTRIVLRAAAPEELEAFAG